jgi:formylglycine-generating enzyme required for sulfatase activity
MMPLFKSQNREVIMKKLFSIIIDLMMACTIFLAGCSGGGGGGGNDQQTPEDKDATPPSITSVSRNSDDNSLIVYFSEQIVFDNSMLNISPEISGMNSSRISCSSSTVSINLAGLTLVMNQDYTFTFTGVKDLSGNIMPETSWSFGNHSSPSDKTPPSILSSSPANGALDVSTNISMISVNFSEQIIFESSMLSFSPAIAGINARSISCSASSVSVNLTGITLASNTPYTLTFNGVRDLSGNIMPVTSVSFTTMISPDDAVISNLLNSMVSIPGGSFQMGSTEDTDEQPVHTVTLSGFYIGATEVTQEQYLAVMGTNPSYFHGSSYKNFPVEQVTWDDAREFCQQLSVITGWNFSLPSEAQWEYACRAGTSTRYSFGESDALLEDYAWFSTNSGNFTHLVGNKLPNPWGLYDIHGNVYEWCLDVYRDSYYGAPTDGSTWGKLVTDSHHIIRGGSWFSVVPRFCRSSFRLGNIGRTNDIGFRVVAIP